MEETLSDDELNAWIYQNIFGLCIHDYYKKRTKFYCTKCSTSDWIARKPEYPDYCNSISKAWAIVEKLTQPPTTQEQAKKAVNGKFAYWFNSSHLWSMSAKEASRAICEAAKNILEKK